MPAESKREATLAEKQAAAKKEGRMISKGEGRVRKNVREMVVVV